VTVEVRDNPDNRRFEAWLDGHLAGFAQYRRRPSAVVFTHTEVDPAYRGRGVAGVLASSALARVREAGEKIVVICPYIAGYLREHPEDQDLVLVRDGADTG
jgi:predicted GNAT family acetyltransferase